MTKTTEIRIAVNNAIQDVYSVTQGELTDKQIKFADKIVAVIEDILKKEAKAARKKKK